MNFPQAVVSGFKNYATFSGRAGRSEYWYWVLFSVIGSWILQILDYIIFDAGPRDPINIQRLNSLFFFATLLPSVAVWIRRLHDVDRSGWWTLIPLTIIGIIPMLYWTCIRGTAGPNRFGPDPLA